MTGPVPSTPLSNPMAIMAAVKNDPRVKSAEERLASAHRLLDQVETARKAPRETLFTLQPDLYQSMWTTKAHEVAQFCPLIVMGGLLAGMLATAFALPAVLAPARSLLSIGVLVGGFWGLPRLIGVVGRKFVIPPMVDKGMRRNLDARVGTLQYFVNEQKGNRDQTVQQVTQELWKKASDAPASSQPPAGVVSLGETDVTVGGLKIGRQPTPSRSGGDAS